MKMNIEGKVFDVIGFSGNNILTDVILVSFGFTKSPSIEEMIKDDGKTPIHSMKLVDTISENVLKENMTLSDIVLFNTNAFMAGLNFNEIAQATKLSQKALFDIAEQIEFTPAGAKSTIQDLCEDPRSIDDIFAYLVANYVAVNSETKVDKFVCDAKDNKASIILMRGDESVAKLNISDGTVSGKEAETVIGTFLGLEGKSITLEKGKSVTVSVPKTTKPKEESKPVVTKEGDTTVISNPTENVVLADTVQGVTRIDLKTLYRYVAEGSLRHVPYEDKADVMIRLEAAIKSLAKDPENIKKYFKNAPKLKYGFLKTQYKNKGVFMLTNGDKYWKFGVLASGEYVFNFFGDMKEADVYPVIATAAPEGEKATA